MLDALLVIDKLGEEEEDKDRLGRVLLLISIDRHYL